MGRILSAFLCLSMLFAQGVVCRAQETDELLASLIRVEARADFAFRYDLTNKETGESAPIETEYYLSAYQVTNGQYSRFVAETGRKTPNYWKGGKYPEGKEKHPVLNVSYSDAVAYCNWLSAQYEGWHFRLPTEAEWENAAMGTYYGNTAVKYPNGPKSPSYDVATGMLDTSFNYNGVIAAKLFRDHGTDHTVHYIKGEYTGTSETLGECISISKAGSVSNWANHGGGARRGYFLQTDLYAAVAADGGHTTPVGTYEPNSLGLYDMAGNAWDLTSTVITAQNGLEKGVDCYAVRGGSWYATARSCTVHYRGEGRKDSPSSTVGFRLAADRVSPAKSEKEQMVLTIGRKDAVVFGVVRSNDVAPLIRNGRTMLPAKFVAEHLGAKVFWTADKPDQVRIAREGLEIVLFIGKNEAYVNGEVRMLDVPAFVQDGRTYAPVKFICEELDALVEWRERTQQVVITPK